MSARASIGEAESINDLDEKVVESDELGLLDVSLAEGDAAVTEVEPLELSKWKRSYSWKQKGRLDGCR